MCCLLCSPGYQVILNSLSISKVESRPSPRSIKVGRTWEYSIYLDIDGSIGEKNVLNAINNVTEFGTVTLLGSFAKHQETSQLIGAFGIGL